MGQKSILEGLYHGEICPVTKGLEDDSQYAELTKILLENEEKLMLFR